MPSPIINLRSDTFTRPTPEMRAAMASAPVGDDVYGEDPTVIELQEKIADLLEMEAALFVPSGTMSNQMAVRVHCQPGEEFLCEADCHIYNYEQGAYAQLFGIAAQPIAGCDGVLHVDDLADRVRQDSDLSHATPTRLLCLENTHNRAAGRVLPYDTVEDVCAWAAKQGLTRHLDGARLINAVVASGIRAADWARHFDTVSVCFSKGLGAPVGSALCGPRDLIRHAHRLRKVMGGGMRQAGIIAAGAIYSLDHHVERLAEDHQHAQVLADAVREAPRLSLRPEIVDTNIVIFEVDAELGSASDYCQRLAEHGVMMSPVSRHRVRAVTHMEITSQDAERAAAAILETADEMCPRQLVR